MRGELRKVAANEVLAGNDRLEQCVVEIRSGVVTGYYHFSEEQPNTEWLGGTIVIKDDGEGRQRAYKNGILIK